MPWCRRTSLAPLRGVLGHSIDGFTRIDAGPAQNSSAHVVGCPNGGFDAFADAVLRRPRATPARVDRPLLPDARLAVRGRGRRAGHAAARVALARALRGALLAALVALPDRHERLL